MQALTLKEFLEKKREADRSPTSEVNWAGRKDAWLDRLHGLFQEIKDWLGPLQSQNLLDFSDEHTFEITEEKIGTYQVPRLDIFSGSDRVCLSPVGTLIVGNLGRVDMKGPKGREIMLILSESDRPSGSAVSILIDKQKQPEASVLPIAKRIKNCKWYFVHPMNRQQKLLLTREVFENILIQMFAS